MEWINKLLGLGDYSLQRTLGAERSSQWPRVRENYISLHPNCAVCATDKNCEVHHRLPFHDHPELELDPTNFITLCRDHHYLYGHLLNWSSFNVDVEADAMAMRFKINTRP